MQRRDFLRFAVAGAATWLVQPRLALASAATEQRFVFVIQRGAADGLNTVIPYADPAYAALRGKLAIDLAQATRLDGMFALHGALTNLAAWYGAGQALFVHAVASPYRDRSHFDGQNVLESGGQQPYGIKDGWLNRLLTLLPRDGAEAIALAATVPLALRGQVEVASYAPSALPQVPDDLLQRVSQLYAQDAQLHGLWDTAMQARGMTDEANARQDPASMGKLAGSFLNRADGARIAMLETGGWDTHSGQEARLQRQLGALDSMLAALCQELGPVWQHTTVLVATEFGRTAAANGTGGTDHGTAALAMLLGGRVHGGRVLADWPGLGPSALYQGRDLQATASLDALIAATCAAVFSLDPQQTARVLFPQGLAGKPMVDLLRST